jgi:hypothetical protein
MQQNMYDASIGASPYATRSASGLVRQWQVSWKTLPHRSHWSCDHSSPQ